MPIMMTGPRTVPQFTTLNLTAPLGYQFGYIGAAGTTLTVAGTAQMLSSAAFQLGFEGVRIDPAAYRSRVDITSTGRFIVGTTNADNVFVTGIISFGVLSSLTNAGVFEVSGRVFAKGVDAPTSEFAVHNSGRLTVRGDIEAIGIDLGGSGTVMNSGLIEVHSERLAIGVNIATANPGVPIDGVMINAGTITASAGPDGQSIGVMTSQRGLPHLTRFQNAGLISADIAFYAAEDSDPDSFATHQSLINTGVIEGDVLMGRGQDEVVNSGEMTGVIDLGDGHDLYDARHGLGEGPVFGGSGNDTFLGGAGNEVFIGELGEDIIFGGGGDDFIDGGRDGDVIDGGEGWDSLSYATASGGVIVDLAAGEATGSGRDLVSGVEHVIGSTFNDRLKGSGATEVLEGGAGSDVLEGRGGDDLLIGGAGADTLAGGAGDDAFFFSIGHGADTITDFKAGGGADRLMIHGYAGYRELRQQGADTLVILSDTDVIRLSGISAASLTADDFVFNAAWTGTSLPDYAAPYLPLLRETFVVHAGESLVFTDTPEAPVTLAIEIGSAAFPEKPSLYNAGLISDFNSGTTRGALGVFALLQDLANFAGSIIVNAAGGVIRAHSSSQREAAGIDGAYSTGEVYNAGRIEARSDGGDAYGVGSEVRVLVNTGVIEVHAAASGLGARAAARSTFFNSGDIIVHGGQSILSAATTGVVSYADLLTNTGRIIVTEGTAEGFSIGINLSRLVGDSVVLNTGLIEADQTIYELTSPYNSDATRIYNTGELRGAVSLTYGRSEVHNAGRITGETSLFDGDDYFDGRTGVQGAVFGGEGADVLLGGAAVDRLDGGGGNDLLHGGGGQDRMTGGSGADVFGFGVGDGRDVITDFAAGTDLIHLFGYGAWLSISQDGNDAVIALSATDSLRLTGVQAASLSSANFVFNATPPAAAAAFPTPPTQPAIPDMPSPALPSGGQLGSAGADTLGGGDAVDRLSGGAGNDELTGGGGDDLLHGGEGDDTLRGGAGDDDIDGGAGHDVLILSGARDAFILLEDGDGYLLKGPEGHDRLTGIEEIRFSDGQILDLSGGAGKGPGGFGDDGPLVLPGGPGVGADARDPDAPLVLPGLGDKGAGSPQVLPAPDELLPVLAGRGPRLAWTGGLMPTLDPEGHPAGGSASWHPDWMA